MTLRAPTMSRTMEHANRYHQWVFSAFKSFLITGGVTLEIGGGHGEYTKLLAGLSSHVIVTDTDSGAIERMKAKLLNIPHVQVVRMDGVNSSWHYGLVDNIVIINLLEHVKNDHGLIRACVSILRQGGRIIIFSPAFHILFSEIDRQAGHCRRYSRFELKKILEDNNLKQIYGRYFNFLGFWGWLFNKLIRSGVDSKFTNFQISLFDRMILVSKYMDVFSCFCGQSRLVIGEKRGK